MSSNNTGFDNLAFTNDQQMTTTDKGSSNPSDYKTDAKRRNKEKCMLYFLMLFGLAIIALIVAVIVVAKKDNDTETVHTAPEVCLTPDCAQAAARLMDSVDTSVNPCDDFYGFTCGKWKRKNIIPEDKSRMMVFDVLREEVDVTLKYLLEDENKYNDVEAIRKAKDTYASCIDMESINNKNTTVMMPLLEELGGWPSVETGSWNESAFNFVELLTTVRSYNLAPIISMYVTADLKDSDNRIIYLDSPGYGMPGRLYYLNPDLQHMREAYVQFGKGVAVLVGADETVAENDMNDILRLETELANITISAEDSRDTEALYNKMTISELAENFTEPGETDNIKFNWFEYLHDVMNEEGVGIHINQSEQIIVRDVAYFQRLFSVLQKYDKRTIANYLVWYIVRWQVSYLDSRFLELNLDYNKVIYGTQTSPPRWEGCVGYAVRRLSMAVGHMFVKETFDESAKSATLEMISNIREAFSELLEETDWMDEETKVAARGKMESMQSWIGYPDEVIDPAYVNDLYKEISVSKEEYFKGELEHDKRDSATSLGQLREKYDKNVWTTPPSTVNAFYHPLLNNIMFPAGILQPPFYSKDQPKSMNYGAIGVVIGHEITHGFDDSGRRYDKDGNLAEWWKPEIIENFKQKAQCIIVQYAQFVAPEANMNVNGINTQGENIADNGGLKQSFRAYRRWVEKRGSEEPTLPGLNYTNNQLFFISFAQVWCNNYRKEAMIDAISNGVHSPGQFRATGPMQNSKEFAQAFGCSSTQYMNPTNKCSVW